jgi:hypothetical protein
MALLLMVLLPSLPLTSFFGFKDEAGKPIWLAVFRFHVTRHIILRKEGAAAVAKVFSKTKRRLRASSHI